MESHDESGALWLLSKCFFTRVAHILFLHKGSAVSVSPDLNWYISVILSLDRVQCLQNPIKKDHLFRKTIHLSRPNFRWQIFNSPMAYVYWPLLWEDHPSRIAFHNFGWLTQKGFTIYKLFYISYFMGCITIVISRTTQWDVWSWCSSFYGNGPQVPT